MSKVSSATAVRPKATSAAHPFVKPNGRARAVSLGGLAGRMMTLDSNVNRHINKVGVWFGGAAYQLDPKSLAGASKNKVLGEALTGVTGDPNLLPGTAAKATRIKRGEVFGALDRATRLPGVDTPEAVTARQSQLRQLMGPLLADPKMIAFRVSAPITVQPYSGVVALNAATGRLHVLGAWTHG